MATQEHTEIWKPVSGYEAMYEVSSAGRVRSLSRILVQSNGIRIRFKGRVLTPWITQGYRIVSLCNEAGHSKFKVSRLVAEAFIGPIPDSVVIDHIDRDTQNDCWTNLRFASVSQNVMNSSRPVGVSGYRGVVWDKHSGRWKAQIGKDGKCIHLGLFVDPAVAHAAYKTAQLTMHGEFSCRS